MLKTSLRLASVSALALATPAFAQEATGDVVVTAQQQNETQVIHAGSLGALGDKQAADVPFAIKSYGEALILNQQPQTLGQVLENDPSIRTTYGYGNAAEQFVIRGFTLYGDDIGLDGLYGITPRQLIAPQLYQEVQVLNGASAFLNGAAPGGSGIGGSVNLIPKRAGDTPLTRLTANYGSTSNFGGSADISRRFGADGAFGVRINGTYTAGDVGIDDEFRRTEVLGAGLDWHSDRVRVSLDLGYQKVQIRNLRPKVTVGAFIPKVPKADANYGQSFSYTTLRDVFGTGRIEYDLSDNAMVYAAFGARDGSEKGIYESLTVTNATTGAATGTALYVPRTDNNEAAQAGVRVKLAAGGVTQEFNFGGSYSWQVNRNAYDFLYGPGYAGFATNLYNTPNATLPSSTLVGGDLDDPFPISRTKVGSAFASDTLGFFDDRVLFTAGLRLQKIDTTSYKSVDGSVDTRLNTDAVTPVLGLVVKPVAGLSLYANRIEGLIQGDTAPAGAVNSGEIFPAFRSKQYEVGGKLAIGRFNAGLAAFQIDKPSAYSVVASGSVAAGTALYRYGVFGVQRNRGIELSLDGEVTRGLRVIGGASYIDAKLRRTGDPLTDGNTAIGVPKYLANANVEWDLGFIPGLTLTGRVVYTGKQQVNTANTLQIPDWTRFDAGARYVADIANKPVTLRLGVDNLANKRYWSSAFNTFGTSLLQGTPRTLKLSMSVDM